jgi:hypothetical protein
MRGPEQPSAAFVGLGPNAAFLVLFIRSLPSRMQRGSKSLVRRDSAK